MWVGQFLLVLILGWIVWRRVVANWSDFRSLDVAIDFSLPWIILSAVLVWIGYAVLIAAWRTVLSGWGQQLPFLTAARVWCVSNLGRYLPGKVWSVAGLTVLAQREGVQAWAAVGAAFVMQALAVGTGAAVVAAAASGAATPLSLAVAAVIAGVGVVGLSSATVADMVKTATRGKVAMTPLPLRAVVLGTAAAASSWVLYGLAFWMLGHGIVPGYEPPMLTAIGVFTAGYIVGLIALFAPGGVGVRELVFVGMLEPSMGAGAAVALTIASRLLLTATEVTAALAGWVGSRGLNQQTGM